MKLAGLTHSAFLRIAKIAEASWDDRERITTSLAARLGDHIQSQEDRPELAVRSNLYQRGADLIFEMIELLWQVKEDVEAWTGFETMLEDDWTVRFVEAA
jgi:hypothetical protein